MLDSLNWLDDMETPASTSRRGPSIPRSLSADDLHWRSGSRDSLLDSSESSASASPLLSGRSVLAANNSTRPGDGKASVDDKGLVGSAECEGLATSVMAALGVTPIRRRRKGN